ncbi:hypothetical protein AYI70_g2862 [Smittium culicis]|uniref:Uncharacterized protein n=2 Tax=Smittium culicis TaxID=133412 RepID=A0A1R1Y6E4_9FUNG|nr:hypothetical protein AYI70_g2862 [Smittium culicis]
MSNGDDMPPPPSYEETARENQMDERTVLIATVRIPEFSVDVVMVLVISDGAAFDQVQNKNKNQDQDSVPSALADQASGAADSKQMGGSDGEARFGHCVSKPVADLFLSITQSYDLVNLDLLF